MPDHSLRRLAHVACEGLRSVPEGGIRPVLGGLFGERFLQPQGGFGRAAGTEPRETSLPSWVNGETGKP